ncbi:glycosyltransferase family 25 protein [Pleomorphomonas sp. NRK KF1]|uniref:glycosyltransferase family 25 protein n=1 Tax=Pleomorphomonas sp. NRK KF1 TaxID=2943000 RepID=UPI0020436DE7|nr:glycosyltransferase family 25 protein [Pleomorphomonas sp. NRK KF1]MCM5552512.1 glycosyltransferase family 25 protein [Pleomorphomonas sp. NRK KF1]
MTHLPRSGSRLACYLINLERAVDRRALMADRLEAAGLEHEIVNAVDGKRLQFPIPEFSELSFKLLHGRRIIPAEVGCYLSHIECAKQFLKSGSDYALILEDDVSFADDFVEAIDLACVQGRHWDILRLTTVNREGGVKFKPLSATRSLAVALTRKKGAGAYVVNRRAAAWMVEKLMPMRLSYDIAFDLEYLSGLKACFVLPQPASQLTEMETQIQVNINSYKLPRYRYFTVLPYRAFLETARVLVRGFNLGRALLRP